MNRIHHHNDAFWLYLRGIDFILVNLALVAAAGLRLTLDIGIEIQDISAFTPPLTLFLASSALWIFALDLLKVYSRHSSDSLFAQLLNLLVAHGIASLLFFGFLYLTYRDFSRLQAIYVVIIGFVLLAGLRIYITLYRRFITNTLFQPVYRVCIVGTGQNAAELGGKIDLLQQGIKIIGYYHFPPESELHVATDRIIENNIVEFVNSEAINEIIIAVDSHHDFNLRELVVELGQTSADIRLALDYSEIAYFKVTVDDIVGIPVVGLRETILSPLQILSKRLIDIAIASLTLFMVSPLMILIAIAIKLDSKGSIIIRQQRIGQYGIPFTMFKFRSMKVYNPTSQKPSKHKIRHDPRITSVGKIIRQWSLDELPQLFNVIIGDMSLVGPRPELPDLVNLYEPWQRKRFEVPQGMTGWWQVNGRAEKPMIENTEYDLYYIANYSIWMDLWILLQTPFTVLGRRGAY